MIYAFIIVIKRWIHKLFISKIRPLWKRFWNWFLNKKNALQERRYGIETSSNPKPRVRKKKIDLTK